MKRLLFLFGLSCLSFFPAFAQGEQQTPARSGNMIQTLIMIALAFVFFYFILWRPEKKRRKAMEKLRNELKKGDRVTAMGIIGTVCKIQDTTVVLKMIDGNKIEMLKGAITEIQPATEEELKKVEKEEGCCKKVEFSPPQE